MTASTLQPLVGPPALVWAGSTVVNSTFVIALGATAGNNVSPTVYRLRTYMHDVNTVNDTAWEVIATGMCSLALATVSIALFMHDGCPRTGSHLFAHAHCVLVQLLVESCLLSQAHHRMYSSLPDHSMVSMQHQ